MTGRIRRRLAANRAVTRTLVIGLSAMVGLAPMTACRVAGQRVDASPANADSRPVLPATVAVEPAAAVVPESTAHAITTRDGRRRDYRLFVPAAVVGDQARPLPLLVALHGGTGSAGQFEANSGFNGLAESNQFIVAYPEGLGIAGGDAIRTWNAGSCCGPAAKQGVDDVGFVRELIAELRGRYPIDPARVFATGHSNGGMLAYRLACELADQVVAVGVQSASLEVGQCAPSRPASLLHIHGSADRNVPIEGGEGDRSLSGNSFNPPAAGARAVATADGCPVVQRPTVPGRSDLAIELWDPCRANTVVELVVVEGASHAWMGHAGRTRIAGEPYSAFDSSYEIWSFLAAHPRRG